MTVLVHGVTMSAALREAATYSPYDTVVLRTYEFTHSAFSSRALVVCNYENWVAKDENGVTVTYLAFAALRTQGMDESDQAETPLLRLILDGVAQTVVDALDLALLSLEPVGCVERIYTSNDPSGPAILPVVKTYIRTAKVTETQIQLEAGFGDPTNQPFPRKNYTRPEYPGLSAN